MIIDFLVALGLLALITILTFRLGKRFITTLTLSVIISIPVFNYFVKESSLFNIPNSSSIITYGILIALLFFIIKGHIRNGSFYGKEGIIRAGLTSLGLVLISLLIYFSLPSVFYSFGTDFKEFIKIIDTQTSLGLYLVFSLVSLYLIQPKSD